MSSKGWNLLCGVFLVLVAAAFLPKLFLADTALYTGVLTPRVILLIGTPTKMLFLFLAFHFSRKTAAAFGAGNPVRPSWLLMAGGFLAFFLAQSVLSVYQIFLYPAPTPYPSPADPLFILGTLGFLAAYVSFIFAYRQAGFPVGTPRQLLLTSGVLGLVLAAAAFGVVLPMVEGRETALGLTVDVTYISMDMLLLAPVFILLTTAVKLRGGALVKVWGFLLAGTLCLTAGDILGGYFAATGLSLLDPILDLMFAWSYILSARGAVFQYELAR